MWDRQPVSKTMVEPLIFLCNINIITDSWWSVLSDDVPVGDAFPATATSQQTTRQGAAMNWRAVQPRVCLACRLAIDTATNMARQGMAWQDTSRGPAIVGPFFCERNRHCRPTSGFPVTACPWITNSGRKAGGVKQSLLDLFKWGLILVIAGAVFYMVFPRYNFSTTLQGVVLLRCNTITGEVEAWNLSDSRIDYAKGKWEGLKNKPSVQYLGPIKDKPKEGGGE